MNLIERIYRADQSRKSRFHTASGVLCVNPFEVAYAATTTLSRAMFGVLVRRPWLVGKALPIIESRVPGARVFEYGAGMSTLWFSNKAAFVASVESNAGWAERLNAILTAEGRPPVVLRTDPEAYARQIESVEGSFDIILVDGINRRRCVEECVPRLRKGGLLILDNTDVNTDLIPAALSTANFDVKQYSGYAPGVLHPNETSVLTKLC
ncbi:Predicted O-methyltransferase YrrM [Bradyrhizobium sp. Rc2d]|uniref:hypothetical protein n=1 Tax=Bradyrhizobium sp. Rc2d TaxID=1855321 RepID=UPI000880AF13|nr:hypothetical protein [Bradyrhizobium sp. Rc2d]SDH20644.1 Predicted O-methyltransferase YrrM [Bradyrhizobium sp. Rc2d]